MFPLKTASQRVELQQIVSQEMLQHSKTKGLQEHIDTQLLLSNEGVNGMYYSIYLYFRIDFCLV